MQVSIRNLVLSAAALCATTAFAATQTRVDVPFNFVAKNHVYQAGPYNVELDQQRSLLTIWSIDDASHSLMAIVGPADRDPQHRVSLVFDVMGTDHVLRSIQFGDTMTRRLDAKPKHGVETITTFGE